MTNWVSFYFFGARGLTDIEELHDLDITAASECHNKVLFGTSQGEIWVATTPGAVPQKIDLRFPGPVLHITTATYSQRVLIVFKDENANFVFHVYNTTDFSALYEIVVPDSGFSNISFLTCSPKMSRFAFTIDRKTFFVYTLPASDKAIERIQRTTSLPETKTVDSTITGLFLANDNNLRKYIYVLCINALSCYDINSKGSLKFAYTEPYSYNPQNDDKLACLGPKGYLYVCQGKNVSVFTNHENIKKDESHKKKEIILDGVPHSIYWFRQYIVCTFPNEMNKVKIYEPATHCIFGAIPSAGEHIKYLLNEWGGLIIVQENNEILVLDEPSTEQKIQNLCSRFNQFEIALKLAKKQKLPPTVIATIHRDKGKKAYNRKNFEEAINEYILTIGSLEPSFVIKQFLDPQHAGLLIRYLEELQKHEAKTASASTKKLHSTLLFNCYAKLRHEEIIAQKIAEAAECAVSNQEPSFDVDSAIDVLNHSGYTEFARELAKSFGKHQTYMKILYDSGEHMGIFQHFQNLNADVADSAICEYGGWIISRMQSESEKLRFADFMVSICTKGIDELVNGQTVNHTCNPEHFKIIFNEKTENIYHHFLNRLCEINPQKLTETLWNDFIATTLACDMKSLTKVMNHPNAKYSTEQALIILQEPAILLKDKKKKYDEAKKANKQDDPILQININDVTTPLGYINAALIALYNKRQVYTEILEILPPEKIPNACETYGENDPHFWLEGLREAERRNKGDVIKEIVRRIHEKDLFPLNSLLKPKISFSEFTFDIFADLIQDDFQKMQKQIEEKSKQLESIDEQLQKDHKIVDQLTTQYYTIKPVNCSFCKLPIDRPSYHFLCGHAYHKHCLDGGAVVCRVCKDSHLENAQTKITQLEEAKNEKDILQKIKQSNNPQDALNALLEGGFFAPELEFGGEEAVHELAARLQPPLEQIKCD
ncbi:vacuolar membrane protein pep11 [Tritrichomonas foetus]|uniref:Vacuolar membrane protein pep11 n=1 Tax=Tritrichomonas foetus TaxID=1144522 RepID=A0A1J4KGQ3_9EUKA|nr:vacuolar membrane protein pep11 [Tritrichomonas foetus]|eukprot:OHT10120.1 vacuolar membrane protein pep11 [Tritrichomonas foetus]